MFGLGRKKIVTFSRRLVGVCMCTCALAMLAADDNKQPEKQTKNSAPAQVTIAHLLRVPLPITGQVDTELKRAIDQLLDRLSKNKAGGVRPTIVLSFQGSQGQHGQGSEFERALSLARYLTSSRLRQVRTVAYLPKSVKGHAVLPVLACDQIVMHPDAELGEAGIDEEFIDQAIRNSYRDIANTRRLIDANVVQGMLDRDLEIFRVTTIKDEVRYLLAEEFQRLQDQGLVKTSDVVIAVDELGLLSGYDLRQKYQFVSHLASNRSELAKALGVPLGSIAEDPSLDQSWNAVQVELVGPINSRTIDWMLSSLGEEVRSGKTNLIVLRIDSRGGAPQQSMYLANFLADLDSTKIRTVAYVQTKANGDAALLALACDQLIMGREATLGGPGDYILSATEKKELQQSIREMAKLKSRDWSLMVAMLDPELVVHRYTRQGTFEPRFLCQEELATLEDSDRWQRGAEINTEQGLIGPTAEELGLVRAQIESWQALQHHYTLDQEPTPLKPNWAHSSVKTVADKMAAPWLARTLLFVGFMALLSEAAAPGLGVPGFVSAICFLLFFWSQFFNGNANWLELLLFLTGIVCVGLEIFVIPGFGVFGIGGLLMVIVSIVLASQTFVLPHTDAEFNKLVYSLSMVLAAGAGMVAGLVMLRRILPNAPILNRLMLQPPEGRQLEELQQRESLVDWSHLTGMQGITTTRLNPSGKARFGDEIVDVISGSCLIPVESPIHVIEVSGNHVLVKLVEPPSADDEV